jgi:hypothetical protein
MSCGLRGMPPWPCCRYNYVGGSGSLAFPSAVPRPSGLSPACAAAAVASVRCFVSRSPGVRCRATRCAQSQSSTSRHAHTSTRTPPQRTHALKSSGGAAVWLRTPLTVPAALTSSRIADLPQRDAPARAQHGSLLPVGEQHGRLLQPKVLLPLLAVTAALLLIPCGPLTDGFGSRRMPTHSRHGRRFVGARGSYTSLTCLWAAATTLPHFTDWSNNADSEGSARPHPPALHHTRARTHARMHTSPSRYIGVSLCARLSKLPIVPCGARASARQPLPEGVPEQSRIRSRIAQSTLLRIAREHPVCVGREHAVFSVPGALLRTRAA